MEDKKRTVVSYITINNKDYDYIYEFINNSVDAIVRDLYDDELKKVLTTIEREKSIFSMIDKQESVEKNKHYLIGKYVGFIYAVDKFLSIALPKKNLDNVVNSLNVYEIPHINDIIITIIKNEGIRHGKLADEIGIKKSTLTGIMEKLVSKGIVTFSRPGKYKYYYVTDLGKEYYKHNKGVINSMSNIDSLTEQLLVAISKEDDANGKLISIIEALTKGKHCFKEYEAKSKGKIKPETIFAHMPRIKPVNVAIEEGNVYTVDNGLSLIDCNGRNTVCLRKKTGFDNECIYSYYNYNDKVSNLI